MLCSVRTWSKIYVSLQQEESDVEHRDIQMITLQFSVVIPSDIGLMTNYVLDLVCPDSCFSSPKEISPMDLERTPAGYRKRHPDYFSTPSFTP